MVGSTLNAVIIASSFILAFIQYSENGENQRRKVARDSLRDVKSVVLEKWDDSGRTKSEFDSLISQPDIEYHGIRKWLFGSLVAALALHLAFHIDNTFPIIQEVILLGLIFLALPSVTTVFLAVFIVITLLLAHQWTKNRMATDKYISDCARLKENYDSAENYADRVKKELKQNSTPTN